MMYRLAIFAAAAIAVRADDSATSTATTTQTITPYTSTPAPTTQPQGQAGIRSVLNDDGTLNLEITADDIEFSQLKYKLSDVTGKQAELQSSLLSILDAEKIRILDVELPTAVETTEKDIATSATTLSSLADNTDSSLAAAKMSFEGDLESWIADMTNDMDAYESEIVGKLQKLDSQITAALNGGLSAAENAIATASSQAVGNVNDASKAGDAGVAKMTSNLANYMDGKAYAWQGGTKTGGRFRGKRALKLDREDWDLSGDKFKLVNKNHFEIQEDGVYRLQWWTNQEGYNCHAHTRVTINGKCATGYNYNSFTYGYGSYWRDMHLDFTWTYKKGEKVGVIVNSCTNGWDTGTKSNMLSFQYVGTTAIKPRASTRNC